MATEGVGDTMTADEAGQFLGISPYTLKVFGSAGIIVGSHVDWDGNPLPDKKPEGIWLFTRSAIEVGLNRTKDSEKPISWSAPKPEAML